MLPQCCLRFLLTRSPRSCPSIVVVITCRLPLHTVAIKYVSRTSSEYWLSDLSFFASSLPSSERSCSFYTCYISPLLYFTVAVSSVIPRGYCMKLLLGKEFRWCLGEGLFLKTSVWLFRIGLPPKHQLMPCPKTYFVQLPPRQQNDWSMLKRVTLTKPIADVNTPNAKAIARVYFVWFQMSSALSRKGTECCRRTWKPHSTTFRTCNDQKNTSWNSHTHTQVWLPCLRWWCLPGDAHTHSGRSILNHMELPTTTSNTYFAMAEHLSSHASKLQAGTFLKSTFTC